MSIAGGPDIVENGLVLHLDAADMNSYPGSGTVWTDLSGNGNNGTLTNGPTYSSSNRGQIVFDGTDDRSSIVYSSTNFVNASYTWIIWLIGAINNNGPMPIIGYGSGGWPRLGIRYHSGWIFSQYGTTGTGNIDVYFNNSSTTSWLCLGITADYTNSQLKSYTNGSVVGTVNGWRDSSGNGGDLGLGRAGTTSWPNALLAGSIGCFSVYNRALSASEILQNYNATKGRYGL